MFVQIFYPGFTLRGKDPGLLGCEHRVPRAVSISDILRLCSNFHLLYRSSCGHEMLVCSSDGTVAFFQFEQHEMGDPMSVEDKVCDKQNRLF